VKELLERINELVNYVNNLHVDSCLTTDKDVINSLSKLQEKGCIVQALPPAMLVSRVHILVAAFYTFKSFREGFNISKKPYIEFLLYLLGNRQVHKVLNIMSNEVKNTKHLLVIKVCEKNIKSLTLSNCVKVSLEDVIKRFSNVEIIKRVYDIYGEDANEILRNVLLKTIKLYIDNI